MDDAGRIGHALGPPAAGVHHLHMSAAHDDRTRFERLCELRGLYACRGERDRMSVISIADVVRMAGEALAAADAAEMPTAP